MTGKADAALSRLFTAAKSLNAVSDEIGAQIKELEAALAAHGVGVSAWVDVDRWNENSWSDDGAVRFELSYTASVGYGKHDGKWGLLYNVYCDDTGSSDESFLRDTAREVRISALEKLPELFDKLAVETQKLTEKAKKNLVVAKEIAAALKANGRK